MGSASTDSSDLSVKSSNLDGVQSKLHQTTASMTNGAYKPKVVEEPAEPLHMKPISAESNLLRATSALKASSWATKKEEDEKASANPDAGVVLKQISGESHLLKSTNAAKASTWAESKSSDAHEVVAICIKPIEAESSLLRGTAGTKAAVWTGSKDSYEDVPPVPLASITPICPTSNLLKTTNCIKAADWTGNKSEEALPVKEVVQINPNSSLLSSTKNAESSRKSKSPVPVSPPRPTPRFAHHAIDNSNTADYSGVASRLHIPTAAAANNMKTKVECESAPHWNHGSASSMGLKSSRESSPVLLNDLEGVASRLHMPTATAKNAVYKPKPKVEDEKTIHSIPFHVNRKTEVSVSQAPPELPATYSNAYKDVQSRLLQPTKALSNAAWKDPSERAASPVHTSQNIKPISADSALLRTTNAGKASQWSSSPKIEEKTSPVVVAKLNEDSHLLMPTRAAQAAQEARLKKESEEVVPSDPAAAVKEVAPLSASLTKSTLSTQGASWEKEKARDLASKPRSSMLAGLGLKDSAGKEMTSANTTEKVVLEEEPETIVNEVAPNDVVDVLGASPVDATEEIPVFTDEPQEEVAPSSKDVLQEEVAPPSTNLLPEEVAPASE